MTLSDEDMQLIERSLSGELSEEDQARFDDRKSTSEDFAEEWTYQRRILHTIKADEQIKLKAELRELFSSTEAAKTGSTSRNWLWVAASFVAFVTIWGAVQWTRPSTSLFDRYFEPYPAQGIMRGETGGDHVSQVMQWYARSDYQRVVDALSQPSLATEIDGGLLYLGNAHLGLGNNDQAIATFSAIPSTDPYYEDAQWYLALSYLSKGNEDQALAILRKMDTQHPLYRQSVMSLMEELE